jgi:wyosine [tRNA(Phe)-imidazoG37] synthetase (radical SAM superfamily)
MNATVIRNDPDSTVYGPVFSWRFGNSLGIDLILNGSVCSYRCPYCQLGKIGSPTCERAVFVPTEKVLADLEYVGWDDCDVITVSGNGEPTLAQNLGDVIREVRAMTGKPGVVLTNGSLMGDPQVRKELAEADHVSCKLDAPNDELLLVLNRPVGDVSIDHLMDGIDAFRKEYDGELSIQTMLLPANVKKAPEFVPLIRRIQPDEVHVNVPSRAFPEEWRPELRGDHAEFGHAMAFRLVPADQVDDFSEVIRKGANVEVRVPPRPA